MKKFILLCFTLFIITYANGSHPLSDSCFLDSVFRSLGLEQKIAQLIMIRAYSNRDSVYEDSLTQVIQTNQVGGVCFFKGTPYNQARLTNDLQKEVKIPLLVSIDAEWGLGMRLDSAFSYPRQMAMGALQDDSLIYAMGTQVAQACRRLGIQINFAPVVDVNNNPNNPVINFRSFGENPKKVAVKGSMYMKGLQDHGIISTAKHFPGHGDTETDSHNSLPVMEHTMARMDSIELIPFRTLINEGVQGIMVAHLYIPVLDTSKNIPSTLSEPVISGLLRTKLGFSGFVFTDALDMKGVTKYFKPGEIEVKALQAGNDILLLPQNVPKAIQGIKQAVDSGILSMEVIDQKCWKVLKLKQTLNLWNSPPINLNGIAADLNSPRDAMLTEQIFQNSITLVKNDLQLIPMTSLERRKIASLAIPDTAVNVFQSTLARYAKVDPFFLRKIPEKPFADSLIKVLADYDILLISLQRMGGAPRDSFGLNRKTLRFLDTLTCQGRNILTIFGNPYALGMIPSVKNTESILVTYQDNIYTQKLAAEMVFGGIASRGMLPVTSGSFKAGTGDKTDKSRMAFVIPESMGIPSDALQTIDSIALSGIEKRAYPGCEVLIAKDGKIFYEKSFGTPRYEDTAKVTNDQIYDLASVTKIAATTLAVMKLFEEGKIQLDDSLGNYLPMLKGSNKAGLRIRDIMTHQAGLQAWIPFYEKTLKTQHSFPADSIYRDIINSPVRPGHEYKYSDLGFYLLRLVVEKTSGKNFQDFLQSTFYQPLGLQTMGFNPRQLFPLSRIIPTEYDTLFRKKLIWGEVHDPGAAMLDGISGHAGLFSDAYDLAVIMQMLIQDGSYGGKEYLKPETIHEFTRIQFPQHGNRRGLGFDKPMIHFIPDGPVCESASAASFGHSGFTGTYAWADPENKLVYIFLSNRVYPNAANQKLSSLNIRTNIHQAIYDLLRKYPVK